jgi:hypothetical protein
MLWSEIPKEVDKYRYSTYFYKEKDSDGGKLFAGPPWDFDLGYGNVDYWPPGINYTGWLYSMVEPVDWGIMFWWKRLMEDPYFRDLAKTRWTWLRQNQLSDANIHSIIDSILVHIDEAKDRNYERWPILGQYVWPNYDWYGNTYADEVDYFETFLTHRLAWMDANMKGAVIQPEAGITAEAGTITLRLYNIYFSRHDLKAEHFILNNAPPGMSVQNVAYQYLNQCQLTLNANATGYPDISVTVSEKTTDYWEDITSSPLSAEGLNDPVKNHPVISLFEENQRLHILCDKPEQLPREAEIINMAGQNIVIFQIEQKTDNILPHNLSPGIYLVVLRTERGNVTEKFSVGR